MTGIRYENWLYKQKAADSSQVVSQSPINIKDFKIQGRDGNENVA